MCVIIELLTKATIVVCSPLFLLIAYEESLLPYLDNRTPNFEIIHPHHEATNLDNGELGGSNVKSVNIGCQTGESLLGAIRSKR